MSVVIRVDGSNRIGTGHVMRCIALAQALQRRRQRATFVTRTDGDPLLHRMARVGDIVRLEGPQWTDADATIAIAKDVGAVWVVIDGYDFTEKFRALIRRSGLRTLYIDDLAEGRFESDVVLNQNLYADERDYRRARHTQLLLGPRYALLREEFASALPAREERDFQGRPRVLVTLGGADPANCTTTVVRALLEVPKPMEIRVVCGAAFKHTEVVKEAARANAEAQVLVGVSDMATQMRWADRCVTAGGSTCWELCRMGVPMAVCVIVEHQWAVANSIAEHGLGIHLERPLSDPERLAERLEEWIEDTDEPARMARRAAEVVDGQGADRIARILTP